MVIELTKVIKHAGTTRKILSAAFDVHNTLGCGFLEKVYENALIHELRLRQHKIEAQKDIKIKYKNEIVGNYICDIVVDDKIVIETKAVEDINNIYKAQLLNYLRATGYEVGLLLNFGKPKLEYKRLVMTRK